MPASVVNMQRDQPGREVAALSHDIGQALNEAVRP
jgi:hypothetical protein